MKEEIILYDDEADSVVAHISKNPGLLWVSSDPGAYLSADQATKLGTWLINAAHVLRQQGEEE